MINLWETPADQPPQQSSRYEPGGEYREGPTTTFSLDCLIGWFVLWVCEGMLNSVMMTSNWP